MHRRAPALFAVAALAALASVSTGCGSAGGARPTPFPTPPAPARTAGRAVPPPPSTLGPGDGYAIARTALALRGIAYRPGGADTGGFDCSGLVQYVFARHGLGLPRIVREQYRYGMPVDLDRLEPGDLVFFDTDGRHVSHVGIAIGGDQFVHAPNSRGVVRINRLTTGYWGERAVGARRVRAGPSGT
jgi:cell wall-associated NlpC family hydrolase